MTNHFHMVASAANNDLSKILRDFKSFSAKKIFNAVVCNQQESRREWMLPIFRAHADTNIRNDNFQLWQQDNHPKECFSVAFAMQKINYIHNNPVVAGLVMRPEDYRLSSARDFVLAEKCGLLEVNILLNNLKEKNSSS